MHAVSYAFWREEESTVLLKPSCVRYYSRVNAVSYETEYNFFTTFMAKYTAFRNFSPDS